jgi:hypothetical protein
MNAAAAATAAAAAVVRATSERTSLSQLLGQLVIHTLAQLAHGPRYGTPAVQAVITSNNSKSGLNPAKQAMPAAAAAAPPPARSTLNIQPNSTLAQQ